MTQPTEFFLNLPLKQRILKLLKSTKDFGGPQTVHDVQVNLQITNGSSRSVLIRLLKSNQIERIGKGTYRILGDSRNYDKKKPLLESKS